MSTQRCSPSRLASCPVFAHRPSTSVSRLTDCSSETDSRQNSVGGCQSCAATDGSLDVAANVSGLREYRQLERGGDKVAWVDLHLDKCKLCSTSPRTWPVADWPLATSTDFLSILRCTPIMLLHSSCGRSLDSSTAPHHILGLQTQHRS